MPKLSPWSDRTPYAPYAPTEEHAAAFAAWKQEPGAARWSDVYPTPAGQALLAAQKAHYAAENDLRNRRVRLVYSDKAPAQINFGVFDRLNREIGARAACARVTVVEVAADDKEGHVTSWPRTRRLGDFFTYTPHALRNGAHYGASQGESWFDTAAERDAAVDKYLDSARKRANKTAGVETLVD